METKGLEIKVGLVALGAIALLAAFVTILGDFSFGKSHIVYVTYNFSGGLEPGAMVKVAGYRAGKVRDVAFVAGEIDPSTQKPVHIKVTLQIDEKVWPALKEGSAFHINTQGLIGEQYVEIVPGPYDGPGLKEGATFRGVDPIRTDLLMGKAYTLLDAGTALLSSGEGGEVAQSLRNFLESASSLLTILARSFEGREKEIGDLVTRINELVAEATAIAEATKNGLGDGEEIKDILSQVQNLIKKGTVVAEHVDKTLSTADIYLEPTLKEAREALADIRKATEVLGALELDPETVKTAVADITKAAGRLDGITADVQSILTEVKTGDGTISLLLRDSTIYDDLKEMLRDLKKNPWKFFWKE